jgi:epoxyqueuosine reductase
LNKTDSRADIQSSSGKTSPWSRRELLKRALIAGAFIPQDFERGRHGRRRFVQRIDPANIPTYKYRILSVNRFPDLQNEYDRSRNNIQLSGNKTFRNQIAPLNFKLPSDFQGAKSIVVLAAFAKPAYANFRLDGKSYRVVVPFQYYSEEMSAENLKNIVQKDIIKTPGRRVVEISQQVPLKLLAGRSALGRYARNNLIFVDGMGSYNLLYAFLTDHPFANDNWSELTVMDECNHCHSCDRVCPTYCISRESFFINIDKCITLYNEHAGEFPNWIPRSAHHALMGCMKCQYACPANEGLEEVSGTLGDISEDETRKILQGIPDDALFKSLRQKLRQLPTSNSKELFPILTRNLNVLIRP